MPPEGWLSPLVQAGIPQRTQVAESVLVVAAKLVVRGALLDVQPHCELSDTSVKAINQPGLLLELRT